MTAVRLGCPQDWDGLGSGHKRGHLRLAGANSQTTTDRIPECMVWDMPDINRDSLERGLAPVAAPRDIYRW